MSKVYLSELKLAAAVIASSSDLIRNGTRLQPGDFSIFSSCETVLSIMNLLHMSILVMTTNTGTPSARAKPRCSLVVPAKRILKIWYLKQFFLKFFSHYPISRAFLFPSASSHWQCCLEGKPLGCGTLMDRHGDQEPLGGDCHTASGILTTEDP